MILLHLQKTSVGNTTPLMINTAKRGMRYFFACRFCNDGLA
jgi:hypothetical protein